MVQAITGQGGGWLLWTEKCGYEDRGIDVQGGVPPLVREVDCFAGPNSALEQLHLRVLNDFLYICKICKIIL